jgi:hypothetical protein
MIDRRLGNIWDAITLPFALLGTLVAHETPVTNSAVRLLSAGRELRRRKIRNPRRAGRRSVTLCSAEEVLVAYGTAGLMEELQSVTSQATRFVSFQRRSWLQPHPYLADVSLTPLETKF